MIEAIIEFFKRVFSSLGQNPAPVPVVPTQPTFANGEALQKAFIELISKDVGIRETNGKNRSLLIDTMNKAAGVDLGSPYCITALLFRLKQVCASLGIQMPFHIEASTQEFWRMAPAKYKRQIGKRGDIGIMQNRSDSSTGHAYCLEFDQVGTNQSTIEYNTDPTGGRDGDGCYRRTRSQNGDDSKKFLGCIDVIQWILDSSKPPAVAVNPPVVNSLISLSWEKSNPERAKWSAFVASKVNELLPSLDKARDVTKIASNYYALKVEQKIQMWSEFICWMCFYESGWNPASQSVDVGTVENKDSWSVGLMQMSVIDQDSYGFKLGYKLDDLLKPEPNLHLALLILARQVEKRGLIMIPKGSAGLYWAVIHPGGKYDKSAEIIRNVRAKLSFLL